MPDQQPMTDRERRRVALAEAHARRPHLHLAGLRSGGDADDLAGIAALLNDEAAEKRRPAPNDPEQARCSTCHGTFDSPACSKNPEGWSGHTVYGGVGQPEIP